jgi:hypothetical protein
MKLKQHKIRGLVRKEEEEGVYSNYGKMDPLLNSARGAEAAIVAVEIQAEQEGFL